MENEILKKGGFFTLTTFATLLADEEGKRKAKGLPDISFVTVGAGIAELVEGVKKENGST